MELFLIQHGVSLSEIQDPEQSLSPAGTEQIQIAARALNIMGVQFDEIICSTKKRTVQTATIIADSTRFPMDRIIRTDAVKPTAPPEQTMAFLKQFRNESRILIAGHLPSIAEITSFLIAEALKVSIRVVSGGITKVKMDSLSRGQGSLIWYLTPELLNIISRV